MKKISMKHVREILGTSEDVFFINVLPKKEYMKGHIPDTINIPFLNKDDFVQRVEKIVPSKNHKIVLYGCCDSQAAAETLEERGFSYVMDFAGGLQEWTRAGGKIEEGKHAVLR